MNLTSWLAAYDVRVAGAANHRSPWSVTRHGSTVQARYAPASRAAEVETYDLSDLVGSLLRSGDLWRDLVVPHGSTGVQRQLRVAVPAHASVALRQRTNDAVRVWQLCADAVGYGSAIDVDDSVVPSREQIAVLTAEWCVSVVEPGSAESCGTEPGSAESCGTEPCSAESSSADLSGTGRAAGLRRWGSLRRSIKNPVRATVADLAATEVSTCERAIARLEAIQCQIAYLGWNAAQFDHLSTSTMDQADVEWLDATEHLIHALIDWRLAAHHVAFSPDPFRCVEATARLGDASLAWGDMVASGAFRTKGGVFAGHGMHFCGMIASAANAVAVTLRRNLGWAGIVPIRRTESDLS